MFHQIEFLPIAYFIVLMWVVCANVTAKLLGPILLERTSGKVNRLLSRRIPVELTGDELIGKIFEDKLLANLRVSILFLWARNFARLSCADRVVVYPVEAHALQKMLVPEQYWSGCPPNAV